MLGRAVVFAFFAFAFLAIASGANAASMYPVAGTQPDRRPDNAPVIRDSARPSEEKFFFGVVKPRPASLSWFADQGGWYTPFNRPGATGPYDIRGWHTKKEKSR